MDRDLVPEDSVSTNSGPTSLAGSSVKKRKKTSWVWDHGTLNESDPKNIRVKCSYCREHFSVSSTSPFMQHLEKVHHRTKSNPDGKVLRGGLDVYLATG